MLGDLIHALPLGQVLSDQPIGVAVRAPLLTPPDLFVEPLYEMARRLAKERPRSFTINAGNPEFITFLRERNPLVPGFLSDFARRSRLL